MSSFVWQIRCIFICLVLIGVLVYGFVPGIGVWIIVIAGMSAAVMLLFESAIRCIFGQHRYNGRLTATPRRSSLDPNYIVISNPGGELTIGMRIVYIQREHNGFRE